MRKLVLGVAVSLDGFIEGPKGEYDWCLTDQDYGLSDFFKGIDALFMGRKTYELSLRNKEAWTGFPAFRRHVFSRTLTEVEDNFILEKGDLAPAVEAIKREPGKNIWLFGGADLTSALLNLGLVDELWLSVHPILLGGGKALFQNIKERINLKLIDSRSYATGLVSLTYSLGKLS